MTEALISVGTAPSINAVRAGRGGPAGQRGSSGAIRGSGKTHEKSPGFVYFRNPDSAFDFKPFPQDRLYGS